MPRHPLAFPIAAASGLALSGAASAQPDGGPNGQPAELTVGAEARIPGQTYRSVVIYYGDLDLGVEPGASAMLRRIGNAARRVCSPEPNGQLSDLTDYRYCRTGAEGRAVYDLGAPMVTNLYRYRE